MPLALGTKPHQGREQQGPDYKLQRHALGSELGQTTERGNELNTYENTAKKNRELYQTELAHRIPLAKPTVIL
jgi:hypothetical protein